MNLNKNKWCGRSCDLPRIVAVNVISCVIVVTNRSSANTKGVNINWNNESVSFYHSSDDEYRFNDSNETYYYFAIIEA